jgi:CheY-like chemotaxis protein
LTQVICNLLNNSAKYGRIGGEIVLELNVRDGFVTIQVRDNGIGIAAEKLQEIFRMYSQVECSQDRGSAGLGIGLALVKSLVELHDGSVVGESEGLNLGSTFTVRLPRVADVLIANVTINKIARQDPRSYRVLVVDDMRAMRVVTEQLLIRLGHIVQVAENGQLALEMLDVFKPDVVLSDITMPGMNGYEFARRARERAELSHVVFVAMTGYGQSSDRKNAFEAGFDRHFTKPVSIQRLQDLFNELDHAQ